MPSSYLHVYQTYSSVPILVIQRLHCYSNTFHDRPDEVVTPHQTTVLKLLDSYLHSEPQRTDGPRAPAQRHELARFFVTEFFTLAEYTQNAICRALGKEQFDTRSPQTKEIPQSSNLRSFSSTPGDAGDLQRPFPIGELDLLLPKVCEALVLVSQCLTSLTLQSEEDEKGKEVESQATNHSAGSDSLKTYVANAESAANAGFVEILLGKSHLPSSANPR